MIENRRNERGFIWNNKWYSVGVKGHEYGAMEILREQKKLYPSENWDWWINYSSAKDFFLYEKRAIQISNGTVANCIIVAAKHYSRQDEYLEKIKLNYNLDGYQVLYMW